MVAEVPDRGALRDAGHAIERESLRRRDGDPLTPGAAMTAAGGAVHWARDGRRPTSSSATTSPRMA
ncbi:hypothetical protein D3273_23830 [Lichenibacterium minor]|uniref:Uncharacterized protein n=1 Tax=Lichenibacterium minor TaxID=2316528 RepID=A0A4Q2TZH1_9HYPH|nr:hypothetical protein D3273_23830 [Lichenibacterium minor]